MMKITNKYYFSTEGETEKWYLQHLEKLINNEAASVCNVSFYVKKSNPVSYVKGINVLRGRLRFIMSLMWNLIKKMI